MVTCSITSSPAQHNYFSFVHLSLCLLVSMMCWCRLIYDFATHTLCSLVRDSQEPEKSPVPVYAKSYHRKRRSMANTNALFNKHPLRTCKFHSTTHAVWDEWQAKVQLQSVIYFKNQPFLT